jgi:hypothetical protein
MCHRRLPAQFLGEVTDRARQRQHGHKGNQHSLRGHARRGRGQRNQRAGAAHKQRHHQAYAEDREQDGGPVEQQPISAVSQIECEH